MVIENQLNLLEEIKKIKDSELIVFFTFTFDPLFFDNSVFKIIKRNNPAATIIVLVDHSIYSDIAEECTDITGNEYILLPIRAGGFFHPKIFLFYSEKKPVVYFGSHNLTLSGMVHNLEITAKINDKAVCQLLIKELRDLLKEITNGEENFLIQKVTPFIEDFKTVQQSENIKILTNIQKPLLHQIIDELKEVKINELLIIAPYFSDLRELIEEITTNLEIKNISIMIDRHHHNLNPKEIEEIKNISLKELRFTENRKLHAKILLFKGEENFLVIGSPNFTKAALLLDYKRGNYESCVVLKNVENLENLFKDCKILDISPEEIKPTIESFDRKVSTRRENLIFFSYLDKITNQIVIISNARKGYEVCGKSYDGTIMKLKIDSVDNGLYKVRAMENNLPKEVWFVEDNEIVSNKCRVYYALSKLDTLPQYRNNPDKINRVIWKLSDISDILKVLYMLFGKYERISVQEEKKDSKERHPSPARLPHRYAGEDIFSLLEKFLRIGSKEPSLGGERAIETGERVKRVDIENKDAKRDIDYEIKTDKLLEKIKDGFIKRVLPLDNSISRYIQYLLICLKIKKLFEENYGITADKHYIQILEGLNNLLDKFPLDELEDEDFTKLFAVELFAFSQIKDTALKEFSLKEISHILKKKIIDFSLKYINNPDEIFIFNEIMKDYGLKPIKIDELEREYLPKIIVHSYAELEREYKMKYLKNLIDKFEKFNEDKKVLIIFRIIRQIVNFADKSLKIHLLNEFSKIDKKPHKRFKKSCIKEIKEMCGNH